MKKIITTILLFLVSSISHAETVYLKPSEALKLIFSSSEEVIADKKSLTPDQKEKIEKTLGHRLAKTDWTFYVAKTKGNIDGYALVDNENGKTEPITFLTAITSDGKVKDVEILVYRETHGSEVKEKRFLKQFYDKTVSDPIKVDQDIAHISGATISSRSMTIGVKRDLLLWKYFYGK